MNSIMQMPQMRFIMPDMPPALSANPEIAKAAQYGGGGSSGTQTAPVAGKTPVTDGTTPPAVTPTANGAAPSGILGSIGKLFGNGAQMGDIASFLSALGIM